MASLAISIAPVNINVIAVNISHSSSVSSLENSRYHHGDLRHSLIKTAERMLADGEPAALSLRALARQAGVSQAAPYRHFADKDALLLAVAIRGFQDFTICLRAALDALPADADPARQLRAIGQAYVAFALDRPGMFRLLFVSGFKASSVDETLQQVANEAFMVLAQVVARCQGRDDPTPRDESVVSAWALVHGLAMLATYDKLTPAVAGGLSPQEIIDRVIASYVNVDR